MKLEIASWQLKLVHSRRFVDLLVALLFVIESMRRVPVIYGYRVGNVALSEQKKKKIEKIKVEKGESYAAFIRRMRVKPGTG